MTYPLESCIADITKHVQHALEMLKLDATVKLETPPDASMGDVAYACFPLAPRAKKAPQHIAQDIASHIKPGGWITRLEAKAGYVNFFINYKRLAQETLEGILRDTTTYGNGPQKNQRIIIEHTSANPNGPLHVGRARNPIIGDTLVRIYRAAGYSVESQFYLDDMGKQVAILTWGLHHIKPQDIPKPSYDKPDHHSVGFYQKANTLMQENEQANQEITQLIRLCEQGDKKTLAQVKDAYAPVLDGMNQSLRRINIRIDKYVAESTFVLDKSVDSVIKHLKKTTYCAEENNALYLDLESFGVQGRSTKFFFTRADGTTLYATRDIAYHLWKAQQADQLINVLGEDHKLESQQVQIALQLLKAKTIPKVIFYAFVSLPEGKMSTRRGRVVYLDELVDEAIERAFEEVKTRRGTELSLKKMHEIAEYVGIGALRFNMIKVQPEKDIVFKWEEALNFEGNSVPFIQYAHARACSILSKKTDQITPVDASVLTHDTEHALIMLLARFPLIIQDACLGCKPHLIASYLFDTAAAFNQFYRDCPVLPEENKEIRHARLTLVHGTTTVLHNGLELLGITAPEEM